MSLTQTRLQPFYFKRYDKVIGTAWDVHDLRRELARLAKEDPSALEYHLREGHIVSWLEYLNEKELAEQLRGIGSNEKAMSIVNNFLERKRTVGCNEPMPFHSLHDRERQIVVG